jgi:NCS1 family nucleobase:cation symporter-1
MFLMFIAGAIAMLPGLADKVFNKQMGSFQDFWTLANKAIWTGQAPGGGAPIGFWHVAAFAWICNLAMHAGLSDMALLRYAKSASYGLYSAFGMFLGHYLAWICAGIMGAATAVVLGKTMSELDAGGVAWQALGACGIIAVVLAGWTTSNPTLYRAGLAFQAVTPGWPRWLVTLAVGIVTTVIACSPFVFKELLKFVGYYGLLLMPVGAIVFVEHWIFPKIGLTRFRASRKKLLVSWPALLSWAIGIGVALTLEQTGTLHLFFLFLPVWFLTAVLYIIFSSIAGAREKFEGQVEEQTQAETHPAPAAAQAQVDRQTAMKSTEGGDIVMWISGIAAAGTLLMCLVLPIWVYFSGSGQYKQNFAAFKSVLIWPTLIYFVAATIWAIKRERAKQA